MAKTTPLLKIERISAEPIEVQTSNPDMVRWDLMRAKRKWPTFEDGPFLWLTFISWAGARRLGLIPASTTFEAWQTQVTSVEPLDDDELLADDDEEGEQEEGKDSEATYPRPVAQPASASS